MLSPKYYLSFIRQPLNVNRVWRLLSFDAHKVFGGVLFGRTCRVSDLSELSDLSDLSDQSDLSDTYLPAFRFQGSTSK